MADIYKKRSQNDQLLIDAQKKIADLEANLSALLETKSKLENQLRETRQKLQETEQKLRETEEDKNNIGDEIISLHVRFFVLE